MNILADCSDLFDFSSSLIVCGYFSMFFTGRKGVILIEAEFHLIFGFLLLIWIEGFEEVGGVLFFVGFCEFI